MLFSAAVLSKIMQGALDTAHKIYFPLTPTSSLTTLVQRTSYLDNMGNSETLFSSWDNVLNLLVDRHRIEPSQVKFSLLVA
jgi:hypothetical protein